MTAAKVNEALRTHVTRVAFDLTLSGPQVEALVFLDYASRMEQANVVCGGTSRLWPAYPLTDPWPIGRRTPLGALIRRGLATCTTQPNGTFRKNATWNKTWKITRAGSLVLELLKEAGLYADAELRVDMLMGPALYYLPARPTLKGNQ